MKVWLVLLLEKVAILKAAFFGQFYLEGTHFD